MAMRIFAKLCFICNLCFLASIPLRMWEQAQSSGTEAFTGAVKLQPVLASIAVLGILAIFLNLVFLILFFIRYPRFRRNGIAQFILWFNLLLLPFQIYYFFFSKF